MPWSTKELADLAGTSLRAVRHYESLGLLPSPPRRANGYKQYRIEHLVRLLRIRRLTGLGFPLDQVAIALDSPDESGTALVRLEEELSESITRLERTRDEVREILRLGITPDLPPELAPLAEAGEPVHGMRDLGIVVTHVLGPGILASLGSDFDGHPNPLDTELSRLPADAEADRRERLANDLIAALTRAPRESPVLASLERTLGASSREAIASAVDRLLNNAQVDVLRRVSAALQRDTQ
jgi:DNA-binding transcriptional MerR regulator